MNPVANALNGINQYTMGAIITPSLLAVAEHNLQLRTVVMILENLILNSDLQRYYLFILDIIPQTLNGVGLANSIINVIGPSVITKMTPLSIREPDDGYITIPMSGMVFNYTDTNYSDMLLWGANNHLQLGDVWIMLGYADRMIKSLYYSNEINYRYSITTLLVTFYNYYTDTSPENGITNTYQYKIRLIKENIRQRRQFVEVYIISSPPTIGKFDIYKIPTKEYMNLCGESFSPVANTSFVFESDDTGTTWRFIENAHVNV